MANEILIKGLANSKTFQKIAVRTDARLKSMKDISNESINSKLDEIHKAASQHAYSTTTAGIKKTEKTKIPRPPDGGFVGFWSAFGKVVGEDLGLREVRRKGK